MKLDDLTIAEAREIARMFGGNQPENPFKIGQCYLIRTVTMIQTGRLVQVTQSELVLEDAAWIPDTGRFSDALRSLDFNEIEPFPDGRVIIGRGGLIDACEIASPQRSKK